MPPGQNIKQKQYCNKFSKEVKKLKKNKATNPPYWTWSSASFMPAFMCFLISSSQYTRGISHHFQERKQARKDSVNRLRLYSQNPVFAPTSHAASLFSCVCGCTCGYAHSHFRSGSPTEYMTCYLTVTRGFITLQSWRVGTWLESLTLNREDTAWLTHTGSSLWILAAFKKNEFRTSLAVQRLRHHFHFSGGWFDPWLRN